MNFSELPPSKQWAALKYGGEKVAEVWFKPEGEPFTLTFRIPRASFQIPGMDQRLTTENLLKAVGLTAEEVDSWHLDGASPAGASHSDSTLRLPLPPPPQDVTHLSIHVSLQPPPQVAALDESRESEVPPTTWQELEARWGAIMGLEATIDTMRLSMESLQAELETASKKTLIIEEKVHALNADVAQWNRAKSRAHFALPKVKEFIHRATWVLGAPERKALAELFKDHEQPDLSLSRIDELVKQLESLLKERQVLSAHGVTVYQECKGVSTELQGALRTLQTNAAANSDRKRRAAGPKGKFFKDIRRMSGAE